MNFDPFANSLLTFIEATVNKMLKGLQTCVPAIVKQVVDRGTVIATPAVQQIGPNWENVPWADIKLPVHTPCGAGVLISCPVAVGDTGWIVAGDLDPSLFFKNLEPAKQNTLQRHKYQFGFFMPDKINGANISADDDGALVIAAGGTKISIKSGKITVESTDELNITGKTVNINGSSNVIINGTDWQEHKHTVPSNIAVQVNTGTGTGATTATAQTGGVD